ncbi:MAG: ribonuclease D [Bacteroidia bacterium]
MNEPNYEYIRTPEDLLRAVAVLKQCEVLALDVEFDRDRYAYGFTLCLIQVFGSDKCWLFDPFSLHDLNDLFALFEDSRIIKVMHAPSEDIQLLNQLGCKPKNIFDTERSARLLDYGAFSLLNLLQNIIGVELNKSMQKSDWTRSPLSEQQLKYAAEDVAWLPELRERLLEQAQEKGIISWLEEENTFWDLYGAEAKPEGQLYNKDDAKKLPDFQLYVYNSLLQVRDRYAKELNKPGYQVIDKHLLMDVVFHPEILDDWMKRRGLHPRVKTQDVADELSDALLKSSGEAEKLELLKFKPTSRVSFEEREKLKLEKEHLKEESARQWESLKSEIIEKLGENALAYIFPDKTLLALTSGEMLFEEIPFNYRQELISNNRS